MVLGNAIGNAIVDGIRGPATAPQGARSANGNNSTNGMTAGLELDFSPTDYGPLPPAPSAPNPAADAMYNTLVDLLQNPSPRQPGTVVTNDLQNPGVAGDENVTLQQLADPKPEIVRAIQWANQNLTGQEKHQYIGAVLNNYSAGVNAFADSASAADAASAGALLREVAQTARASGYDPMQFQAPIPEGAQRLTDREFRALQDVYHNTLWGSRPSTADLQKAQTLLTQAGVPLGNNANSAQVGNAAREFIGDRYNAVFVYAGALEMVPPELLKAQARQESQFDYRAGSNKGALGISQFLEGTASQYGLTNRLDPVQSIMAQARYMRNLYDQSPQGASTGDRWRLALAAYNAGPGNPRIQAGVDARIRRAAADLNLGPNRVDWVGRIPYANVNQYLPGETRIYVPRVMNFSSTYRSDFR